MSGQRGGRGKARKASESKRVRAVIPAWVSRHCNPGGNGRARSGTRAKGRRRARNGLAECTRRRCSGYARFGRVDVLVVRRRGLSLKVSFGCHVAKCKFPSGPSTAKRDGVCLETIQALRLVRNVEGSVSKTRAGCGARARPFGVLCGATLRSHLTRQRQVGKKWVTPALTRHVLAGWSSARFVTQEIPVWRAPSS